MRKTHVAPRRNNDTTRWRDMKTIVKDNKKKRSSMNESLDYDEEDEPMGRVGGNYDFVMMVGNGDVYGFVGEKIYFTPIGD